jgi:hypothetical protein
LRDFKEQALLDRRGELLASFPYSLLATNLSHAWRDAAIQLYRNWLQYISAQKGSGL